jgi:hypothetical protein
MSPAAEIDPEFQELISHIEITSATPPDIVQTLPFVYTASWVVFKVIKKLQCEECLTSIM